MNGFLCSPRLYEFEGVRFEVHSYSGPCPVDAAGNPQFLGGKNDPFWKLWERFRALSPEQQSGYLLQDGGCQRIGSA